MKLNLPPRVVAVCKLIHALTDTPHLVVDEESVTLKNSAMHLCIILVLLIGLQACQFSSQALKSIM